MQELWTTVSTPSLFTDAQELLPFDGSAVLFPRFLDADFARGAFDELQSATLWGAARDDHVWQKVCSGRALYMVYG